MQIKTSELTGAQLDWAVAKCEGLGFVVQRPELLGRGFLPAPYSTNPTCGHPIIEREKIGSTYELKDPLGPHWLAWHGERIFARGDTPLIAAMRAYVSYKLGAYVEIPDSLNQTQPTP